MRHQKNIGLFITFLLVFAVKASLFASPWFVVKQINISGNKWTQKYIITKELDFSVGDTLFMANLTEHFEESKNRLYNTGLFNHVEMNLLEWDTEKEYGVIQVDVVENWFWYPSPILELGDRSFNEWWYEHNASLKRINLGIRFLHINLTGNNDKLKFNFNTGFTRKYEVDYTFPYLNRSKTLGAYMNVMYTTHKEIAFETTNNKLNFVRIEEDDLLTRFRTSLGLKYRHKQDYYHSFILEFNKNTVHDTISIDLNPAYFIKGESSIEHLRFNYSLNYTHVDKNIYPKNGYRYSLFLLKDGGIINHDLNYLHLAVSYEQYFQLTKRYSLGAKIKAKKIFNLGEDIPYFYTGGLGYSDNVLSGYQLYVIDGVDYYYVRSIQKIKLLDFEYDLAKYMPLRQFKVFPLQVFLGIHGDLGYVNETRKFQDNPMGNRLLAGTGLSLDFIVYQNYFFSLEFTLNHLGEKGIFFHGSNTFE